jgi:hypothetical protein
VNIFYLDDDPELAARALCNRHIVKMVLETAQLLCTVLHAFNVSDLQWRMQIPYKLTHPNHPCTLWAGASSDNYTWLLLHGLFICEEYTKRYHRKHASEQVIQWCDEASLWTVLPRMSKEFSSPPQCMPERYKRSDPVKAYRAFYIGEKASFARWRPLSSPPSWWPDELRRSCDA